MKYISFVLLLIVVQIANAELFKRKIDAEGRHAMVYDSDYDNTWLADANHVITGKLIWPEAKAFSIHCTDARSSS